MRNLLPFILLLACPVMMILMMRGMRGGGHESSAAGHDTHPSRDEAGNANGQESEARIAQLEREVAQLRAVRGEHPNTAGRNDLEDAGRVLTPPRTRQPPGDLHYAGILSQLIPDRGVLDAQALASAHAGRRPTPRRLHSFCIPVLRHCVAPVGAFWHE